MLLARCCPLVPPSRSRTLYRRFESLSLHPCRDVASLTSMLLLVSGLPGVGKSTFARAMEFPQTWPRPDLHPLWEESRGRFVRAVAAAHSDRVILDWGFPPTCQSWIKELSGAGVIVCWLFADEALARAAFLKRSPNDISSFEEQMQLIRAAELPNGLDAINVEALNSSGFRPWSEIWQEIQNACS